MLKPRKPSPVDLESLLGKVQAANEPDAVLDKAIVEALDLREDAMWIGWSDGQNWIAPPLTASVGWAVNLVETMLPGWWWTCGYCALTNDGSVFVPGSRTIASLGPDFRAGPEMQALLDADPVFDDGFHGDRYGGTVALALVSAMLQALLAKERVRISPQAADAQAPHKT